jgi:hypothetical protein
VFKKKFFSDIEDTIDKLIKHQPTITYDTFWALRNVVVCVGYIRIKKDILRYGFATQLRVVRFQISLFSRDLAFFCLKFPMPILDREIISVKF